MGDGVDKWSRWWSAISRSLPPCPVRPMSGSSSKSDPQNWPKAESRRLPMHHAELSPPAVTSPNASHVCHVRRQDQLWNVEANLKKLPSVQDATTSRSRSSKTLRSPPPSPRHDSQSDHPITTTGHQASHIQRSLGAPLDLLGRPRGCESPTRVVDCRTEQQTRTGGAPLKTMPPSPPEAGSQRPSA